MARKSIKELNIINQNLKRANDSVMLEIKSYDDDIKKSDEIIQTLMEEDWLLKDKVNSLNSKITQIKSKYEEANSHSNNFDSSRIREYFSNIE